MNYRQPRTYPFLGIFLANLLTNAVLAKLAPLSALPSPYDVDPWLAYNKPSQGEYQYQPHYPASAYWNPIQPYTYHPPAAHTTVSLTTPIPLLPQVADSNSYIPDYYSDYIEDNVGGDEKTLSRFISFKDHTYQDNAVAASNKTFSIVEPVPSGSTLNTKRQPPEKLTTKSHVKRATYGLRYSNRPPQNRIVRVRYKSYKTGQQRKRFTTPYYDDDDDDADDDYEDFTTPRYRPQKRQRPTYGYRRATTQLYDDYDEAIETSTRPYRRKRPTKIKNNRRPIYDDTSYEYDDRQDVTETVTFRPRQASTTTTESTTTEITTTPPSTSTAEMTTTTENTMNTTANGTALYPGQGKDNVSITITRPGGDYVYPTFTGYGPSNGNENISITYGPPSRFDYAAPYVNWHALQPRPNNIIGRVHDIVGFDDSDAFRRRLT